MLCSGADVVFWALIVIVKLHARAVIEAMFWGVYVQPELSIMCFDGRCQSNVIVGQL